MFPTFVRSYAIVWLYYLASHITHYACWVSLLRSDWIACHTFTKVDKNEQKGECRD
jgi:hypothetical protein